MKSKFRIMHVIILLMSTTFIANGQLTSEIDVLVYYTANAKLWIEGTGFDAKLNNVATFIENEIVANANSSLYLANVNNNAKVNIKLNMVGVGQYELTERKYPVDQKTSIITSDLNKFRKDPIVHRKRLDSKADVILLIGYWPGAKIAGSKYSEAGLYIGTNADESSVKDMGLCPNSKNICFAVNVALYHKSIQKLLVNTFLHELGHSLGLHHAKEDLVEDQWANAGMNSYAHGYKIRNDKGDIIGNDIMAYQTYEQPVDPDALIGFVKSQVPLFSSINTTNQEIFNITNNNDFYSQYNLQLPTLGTVNDPNSFNANAVKVLNDNALSYSSFYPDVLAKSCSGLNKEAIHSDDFDVICGESSNGTSVCIGNISNVFMKSAINRNFDGNTSYSFLKTYKYLDRHIPVSQDDKPIGILCKKLQTCVFQIQNSGIQGAQNVHINFLLSNVPKSTISPSTFLNMRTSKKLFTVKCFVDDYLVADPVIIQPKDVPLQEQGETFESTIDIPAYLKVTDKKIQVLVIAEDFDADNMNTVLSIKNIQIGLYSYDSDDGQNNNSGTGTTVSVTPPPPSNEPKISGNTATIYFSDRGLFSEEVYDAIIPIEAGYTGLVKIHWGDGEISQEIGIGKVSVTATVSMPLDYLPITTTYLGTKSIREQGYISHTYAMPGNYTISVEGQRRTYNWCCQYGWINLFTLNPLPNCGYQYRYLWYNVGQRNISIEERKPFFCKKVGNLKIQFTPNVVTNMPYDYLEWNFDDGTKSIENNPIHLFKKPGIYNVTIACKGGSGKTSYTLLAKTLSVMVPADITPIINLLLDQ